MISRSDLVAKTRSQLIRYGYPRLQMLLIVCITGALGFIASFMMLRLGLSTLWLRYVLAMLIAYMSFMGLLWIWLHREQDSALDIPDVLPSGIPSTSSNTAGHAGEFGGGGASGSFEASNPDGLAFPADSAGLPNSGIEQGESGNIGLGHIADTDELAIPLFVLLLASALLALSVWVIYSAPVLFSELLVDSLLSFGLYKHLQRHASRHWLETAVRHTYQPFLLALLLMAALGWGLSLYTPQAHTMGEAIRNHAPDH